MRDFTIQTYISLIFALQKQGFEFLQFKDFHKSNESQKQIVLRMDVDDRKENSLLFAKILNEKGITGTFYFRIVPQSFDEKLIKEIADLGHEVGYHYEDVSRCAVRGVRYEEEELVRLAIESFKLNLANLRKIASITTICMHGSPMSKWDSRLLWKYFDYRDFGIVGEPYFDIDFNEVMYLTDTGRRWDGNAVSIRDKAQCTVHSAHGKKLECEKAEYGNSTPRTFNSAIFPKFHSTYDIIKTANEGLLPDKIMMTFHPQRWTDRSGPWMKELVVQNVKNPVKYFLIKRLTALDGRHKEKG